MSPNIKYIRYFSVLLICFLISGKIFSEYGIFAALFTSFSFLLVQVFLEKVGFITLEKTSYQKNFVFSNFSFTVYTLIIVCMFLLLSMICVSHIHKIEELTLKIEQLEKK